MHVAIYHDTVCPFCRIGKRNFEIARQQWTGETITVEYHPFFLNPTIPPEGYDFVPYMNAKFNGRISLQQALDGPTRMGAAIGLTFNMNRILKAPNSLLSHCLIALSPPSVREAVIEEIYAAYFEHGEDIGDLETLIAIGRTHGLDGHSLRSDLLQPALQAQVEREAGEAATLGINSVPFFIFNQHFGVSGAQPAHVLVNVLRQVESYPMGDG